MNPDILIRRAATAVHARYVARKTAAGVESCVSRHDGVTNLLGDFGALPLKDQEDDLASVDAVLQSLRRQPIGVVLRLLWPDLPVEVLVAAYREAYACDPPPTDLADGCAASAGAAARAGLDAAAVTRDGRADR